MKIAIGQVKLQIGNFFSNTENIKKLISDAVEQNASMIIFPELTTTVKGAKDLLFVPEYLEKAQKILSEIIPLSKNISIIIGGIESDNKELFNTAYLIKDCQIEPVATKYEISLDEKPYFSSRKFNKLFEINNKKFFVTFDSKIEEENADYTINLSSTPFFKGKNLLTSNTKSTIHVNHIGLAQELIYDGGSFVSDPNGEFIAIASNFTEECLIVDLDTNTRIEPIKPNRQEQIFKSLSFAFKEFCNVNNFKKALIGLSGGIDSALTAVIMCDAIGAENVLGITMPSKYSTEGSWNDSYDLAKNLGMECRTVPIKPLFDTFVNDIQGQLFCDLAEENLQARLRGNILMAYSNRENRVLVTTGNKSECAVGYCTLYGDTCGGINLISDLYKQEVYALSNWINRDKEIIPTNTITKAPSAELRPDQKDQDSLPDYAILDEILYRYIENDESVEKISKDFDETLVKDIINKLNIMEFKRNQFTYCLKISKKALLDRNYPIVNKFRY